MSKTKDQFINQMNVEVKPNQFKFTWAYFKDKPKYQFTRKDLMVITEQLLQDATKLQQELIETNNLLQ